MFVIAENDQYELRVDQSKNRIYITIKGFWKSPEVVPNYLKDWERALHFVFKGFTILADVRTMKIHPQSLVEIHEKAIEMSSKKGYSLTAEVVEKGVAPLQVDRIYEHQHVNNQKFHSVIEADAYLDRSYL